MSTKLFLVMGSCGEYSGRMQWPVALYETEAEARAVVEGATAHEKAEEAKREIWHREVTRPWTETVWEPWVRRMSGLGLNPYSEKPPVARPKYTGRTANPYDPENSGDEYWVETVEMRKFNVD